MTDCSIVLLIATYCHPQPHHTNPTPILTPNPPPPLTENWTPCLDSDYEMWTMPKTYTNDDGCLLGAKYAFHRRAEEACCQNTFDFKRDNHIQGKCRCSKLDLECDFGAYMVFNHTMGWPEGLYCRDDAQVNKRGVLIGGGC